nr:helix-turn-helix transcriptional regulator [Bacilli bacterium]
MKINEKIYSLRKQAGLSQEELADKLNVSRQTVSKWELGDSTPDFDKIVPLCNIFGITTEELLRDKKIDMEVDNNKPDVIKAALISISVLLYFIGIVFIVFGEEYLNLSDGILVPIFLFICGLATATIVFTCMTRPSKKEKKEEIENKNPVLKGIISIVALLTTCVYLLVSFTTMAWHITWIIWVIFALIVRIIELIFVVRGDSNEE